MVQLPKLDRENSVEVRRGFGEFDLSYLAPDEFITASGLHDGGYIVWRDLKFDRGAPEGR